MLIMARLVIELTNGIFRKLLYHLDLFHRKLLIFSSGLIRVFNVLHKYVIDLKFLLP